MRHIKSQITSTVFMFFILVIISTSFALSEESYRFERIWPTLKQPWYFGNPGGICLNAGGHVYVTDWDNHRVQKFTSNGIFITSWGTHGTEDGQFDHAAGIAVDSADNVYVLDNGNHRIQKFTQAGTFIEKWGSYGLVVGKLNGPRGIAIDAEANVFVSDESHRIQKFTSDGTFITAWGENGSGNGQFKSPQEIAIDNEGNVYVADTYNHRIQKFTDNGTFITAWGSKGSNNGQFKAPIGIAVDNENFVYVADNNNERVQKFSDNGTFKDKWGSEGFGDGQFKEIYSISVDAEGNVYTTETWNDCIQKFTSEGKFIDKWGSESIDDGFFAYQWGLAIDSEGFIYVADTDNHRIQKFTDNGTFIEKWGSFGSGDGQLSWPQSIAIDDDDNIYVTEFGNYRIQKFTSDGTHITKWGSQGSGDGQFDGPRGIAIDIDGNVLVVDDQHRVQKFTDNGTFIEKWGTAGYHGSGEGEFYWPQGIVADDIGNIYVVEYGNHRVQKFTQGGTFIAMWGGEGSDNGQFNYPMGIALDGEGNVYVVDTYNHRIQKFTDNGTFIEKWGSYGFDLRQMNQPRAAVVSLDDKIYISDTYNNRIQVFNNDYLNSKAVIVAGGGPYYGNNLWDATQLCANFAYRSLVYQGYGKNDIFYLSEDTDLDLDGNGLADDVDNTTTNANLQYAITQWAQGADSLVLYMTNHGGQKTFLTREGETLSAAQLASWLDINTSPQQVVVYDACRSGSFIDDLSGDNRTIITSTLENQAAKFLGQGTVSFSMLFWNHILNGLSISDAFDYASASIGASLHDQTPDLDVNGTILTHIGLGTQLINWESPVIGSVPDNDTIAGTSSYTLYADNVFDVVGVARAWAILYPPGYSLNRQIDMPLLTLPSVDLILAESETNLFEREYSGFTLEGKYWVDIYAIDDDQNISEPKGFALTVNNPPKRRALIVAGAEAAGIPWSVVRSSVELAYAALKQQGYTDWDIYLVSTGSGYSPDVEVDDATPTASEIDQVIREIGDNITHDLVLYMIGDADNNTFQVDIGETLTPAALDGSLDYFQANTGNGTVVVIDDSSYSGGFIEGLSGSKRILIGSASDNETVYYGFGGNSSFSAYFWIQVMSGAVVNDCFNYAERATSFLNRSCRRQAPRLLDTDDLAEDYTIGIGIVYADDPPWVGSVYAWVDDTGTDTIVNIEARNITSTGTVERVWAVISPIDYCTVQSEEQDDLDLDYDNDTGTADGVYYVPPGVASQCTAYKVTVYAIGGGNSTSPPCETIAYQGDFLSICNNGSDAFEDDNIYLQANFIFVDNASAQAHDFCTAYDEDWVKFFAQSGKYYTVRAENLGPGCLPVIELYDSSLQILKTKVPGDIREVAYMDWLCPQSGIYYARLWNHLLHDGSGTGYGLRVYGPTGEEKGIVVGEVTDSISGALVTGFTISTTAAPVSPQYSEGSYAMEHDAGTYTITAMASGYGSYSGSLEVVMNNTVQRNIIMDRESDGDGINDDGDGNGIPGDNPCTGGNTVGCDDNCQNVANPDQTDSDGDGFGDACDNCPDDLDKTEPGICGCGIPDSDSDSDSDGIIDCDDNCPLQCNSDQLDADNDFIGDVCDATPGCGGCGEVCEQECSTTLDTDSDGIIDAEDNCPNNCNSDQLDADSDGIGDVCDPEPGCGGCGPPCETEC